MALLWTFGLERELFTTAASSRTGGAVNRERLPKGGVIQGV